MFVPFRFEKIHYLIIVFVLFLDFASKALVKTFVHPGFFLYPILHPIYNYGIAFSLFSSPAGSKQLMFITPAIAAFLVLLFIRFGSKKPLLLTSSVVLIISGALANSIDRFANFTASKGLAAPVTDFIHYPIFTGNIADIVVVLGGVLFSISIIKNSETNAKTD